MYDFDDTGIGLPSGSGSVEEWGHTVCKLQKLASLDSTYVDLLRHRDSDKVYEYLKWISEHGDHARCSSEVKDLCMFLRRAGVKFVKECSADAKGTSSADLANREVRVPVSGTPGPYRYKGSKGNHSKPYQATHA